MLAKKDLEPFVSNTKKTMQSSKEGGSRFKSAVQV